MQTIMFRVHTDDGKSHDVLAKSAKEAADIIKDGNPAVLVRKTKVVRDKSHA